MGAAVSVVMVVFGLLWVIPESGLFGVLFGVGWTVLAAFSLWSSLRRARGRA
jgi:hypothetical protein